MKGRPKPWNKRKPFYRKKGGGRFHFSGESAGWGVQTGVGVDETIKERLTRTFTNVFRLAPNKLMKQRLVRVQPPANKIEKEVLNENKI